MKIYVVIPAKITLLSVLTMFISMSCMPMGMHGKMMERMMHSSSDRVQLVNTGQAVDEMVDEVVKDLSSRNLDVSSIAVWRIKSHTTGLDVEMIRRKLIDRLVALDRFKVLSRERLAELLDEQRLSLSGTIDKQSAIEIGHLIGVEGFVDGYASIEGNRFTLSLNLVETRSGVIIWVNTIERDVQ